MTAEVAAPEKSAKRMGWLYLTVVIDLYSRAVVGWSMKPTIATELVLDALMMAVWRRRPKTPVMIHSDQGSHFGSDEFNRWCNDDHLVPSMSRWGTAGTMPLPNASSAT
ncbi:transposase InsO family protein [Rhodoferax saidenbachensis]|uniref:Transposase InsO family protein n=1 Tax=Rhodoferax saidenbachensis TaxID=1484693 RepID=A0ABU1ZQW5_9BURK|nr:transposase InsO family protein [Rhodoferax saidenbachensis]